MTTTLKTISRKIVTEAAKLAGIKLNSSLTLHEAAYGKNEHARCTIKGTEWIYWPGFGWRKAADGE